jgi:hypothetical protein
LVQQPAATSSNALPSLAAAGAASSTDLALVDVAAQAYAGGEIRPADLTGREFVSLLKELRLIFLQDVAILQPIYPDLPLWRLPIFRDPEWHAFAEAVRHC